MEESKKMTETTQLCMGDVVRSLRFKEPGEGGWMFDSDLILKIKKRAIEIYNDEITMEHVEAVLLAISEL